MKTNDSTIGLVAGKPTNTTRAICRSLAEKGISAIVVQKEGRTFDVDDEPLATDDNKQWSGQPGKDLFFNGWKLLF
ncbi:MULTISPECIES: hypothetical protein [unclassified Spirosoma]|uniref:hypothetical protein n=1 Tax=unclassified Spirosoma TaxID=2621999 RepID=UPI00095E5BD1|nr:MULTISPECIES: hypothetical protein [unclassified Spirosoma]MBN8826731.1 hypothetical protein [Spirosoma sp.]OJW73822.1 MAG: hypothetical protein BGO59_17560 [Spirosoma sp. 48-14]